MRYRRVKSEADALGQVFTPAETARLMARHLPATAKSVLDLGAGDGALTRETQRRCPDARVVAIEIQQQLVRQLRRGNPDLEVHRLDVVNDQSLRAALGRRRFCGAISNPPFGFSPVDSDRAARMSQTHGASLFTGEWIRNELLFLAAAWERLKAGGQLVMLLPAPLVTAPAHEPFRRWLCANSRSLQVSELPDDVFPTVEVNCYIVAAQKRGKLPAGRSVTLHQTDLAGRKVASMSVPTSKATARMDFAFHQSIAAFYKRYDCSGPRLGRLVSELTRGSFSRKEFEVLGRPCVHTSDFSDRTARLRLGRGARDGALIAGPGDILVPRVGTRCLLRQAIVESGSRAFTEAVYRIQVPATERQLVLRTLESDLGRSWRELHAQGSCAKHLTVPALLSMPLSV
ncbi:MAG: methyltransferase [Nevskia sp.]|nr:methyltransferase [Nevskia sp.]